MPPLLPASAPPPSFRGVLNQPDGTPGDPTRASEGRLHLNPVTHDAYFAGRKSHAATPAEGTGTDYVHAGYVGATSSRVPADTSQDRVFLHLPSDTFRQIYYTDVSTEPQTRVLSWAQVANTLDLVDAGEPYTETGYFGQRADADAAAQTIPGNLDPENTIKCFYYDEDADALRWLSDFTARVGGFDYEDWIHLQVKSAAMTGTQAAEQDGAVYEGADTVSWYGYQRAELEPAGFPVMSSDGTLSFAGTGWYASYDDADTAGNAADTMWFGRGRAYRDGNGNWINVLSSVQAHIREVFSETDDGTYTTGRTDDDRWWKFQLPDGSYSAPKRLINSEDLADRLLFFDYVNWYGGSLDSSSTVFFDDGGVTEIDDFDELLMEMKQWDTWEQFHANRFGPTVTGRILRPVEGWSVNHVGQQFVWTFSARHGIHINIENDTPSAIPADDWSHPVGLSSYGGNFNASAIRSGRMHFRDYDWATSPSRYGGDVDRLINTQWGSTYARLVMRLSGIRHGLRR